MDIPKQIKNSMSMHVNTRARTVLTVCIGFGCSSSCLKTKNGGPAHSHQASLDNESESINEHDVTAKSEENKSGPPKQKTLEDILMKGGTIFRSSMNQCSEWSVTSDGKNGEISSVELDSEGFYRTVSFTLSPGTSELHLSGPTWAPGTEEAETANQPDGWGLIGTAAMCSWSAPIRAQGPETWAVGNERWFRSLKSCTSRKRTGHIELTPTCS